jgi:uncharacterized protein YodC (DUF2158 family)
MEIQTMAAPIKERFCYRGDTVRLKANAREMTVVGWDGKQVICEWVEREVLIEQQMFSPDELVLVRKG